MPASAGCKQNKSQTRWRHRFIRLWQGAEAIGICYLKIWLFHRLKVLFSLFLT